MGFKHHKQSFADEDTHRFAYKHLRQLDYGAEFSPFRGSPGKQHISDGEKEGIFSQSRDIVRLGGDANVPNENEAAMSEHNKRRFGEDKSDEGVFKRARQVDQNRHEDLSADFANFSSTYEGSHNSVVPGEELENRKPPAPSEDPVKNVPSSISILPWFTCTKAQEDIRLESPIRFSFFPGYFEDGHRTTGFIQPEEIYSPVIDYPPRKLVTIGRNHQADVPTLRSQGYTGSFGESASADHLKIDEDDSEKWMGTCVMPMPDSNSLALEVRHGNKCWCSDEGSIRCTRQHVLEAREKLKKTLGQDRFIELGFDDMGETVAQKWTGEEQQLFHEVIASNPASIGKNFWDVLPLAFPSRSSKELVSYYFNVFMLRKRAGQNRADPSNVDSEDDEWQESEDDEDSILESPADSYEEAEDVDDTNDCAIAGEYDEELYGVSKGSISDKLKFTPKNEIEDQDVEDDSCTSFEGQHNKDHSCASPADFVETRDSQMGHGEYGNDGLSSISNHNHEYLGGHCDPKTWEINYMCATGKDVDFLPTCNVIEEFGKGSWEN